MVEHASQRLELRPASDLVWTMIYILHVRRALQMAMQVSHSSEPAAAKVALICVTVPGVFSRPGLPVPFQEVVRDNAVPIALSEGAEDALTVDAPCARARAGLEVM